MDADTVVPRIVTALREAAPPGQPAVPEAQRRRLWALTGQLLTAYPGAVTEYRAYRAVADRALDLEPLRDHLLTTYRDRRVLVTGGTGCIGAAVLHQLNELGAAELVSVSRLESAFDPIPGVDYVAADVRDEAALAASVRRVRPDVVVHCAAQRSPSLGERDPRTTVETNVFGTRNALRAARETGVDRFVHASTGKAMRYHTRDVYAASKKVGEWLVAQYAAEGRAAGLARFTHVVDNPVVLQRLHRLEGKRDEVMPVHDSDLAFYVQSAAESAQLLLLCGLDPAPGVRAMALRDLGEPVRLLALVVGRLASVCPDDHPAIYLSGPVRGYELSVGPGLYDPRTATEISPLVNAVEAARTAGIDPRVGVDVVDVDLPTSGLDQLMDGLEARTGDRDPETTRAELAEVVRHQAEATFARCPERLFVRLYEMAARAGRSLPTSRRPRAEGDQTESALRPAGPTPRRRIRDRRLSTVADGHLLHRRDHRLLGSMAPAFTDATDSTDTPTGLPPDGADSDDRSA